MKIDISKTQKYISWLNKKLYLNEKSSSAKNRKIYRGKVYWCDFGINVGSEMSKETPRPCVVLQKDHFNLSSPNTIVVPITHDTGTLSCLVPITPKYDTDHNLLLDGKVNVSNIVCISKARLGDPICNLSKDEMKKINDAILRQIDLHNYCFDFDKKYKKAKEYIDKANNNLYRYQNLLKDIKSELGIDDDEEIINEIKKLLTSK